MWQPEHKCARRGTRSHGPQWLLTTKVASKTRSPVIPTHALAETCNQVAECLRRIVAELITVSDEICQARPIPRQPADEGKNEASSVVPMGQNLSDAHNDPLFAVKPNGPDSGGMNRTPDEAGVNDRFRPQVDAGQVIHEVWIELDSIWGGRLNQQP